VAHPLEKVEAITLFVEDRHRSKVFYESLLGAGPVYEDESSVVFRVGSLVVNLLDVRAADELVAPAPVAPHRVRPGDALRYRATVLESRVSASKPEPGIVKFRWELFNQRDELAVSMIGTQFYLRRSA